MWNPPQVLLESQQNTILRFAIYMYIQNRDIHKHTHTHKVDSLKNADWNFTQSKHECIFQTPVIVYYEEILLEGVVVHKAKIGK